MDTDYRKEFIQKDMLFQSIGFIQKASSYLSINYNFYFYYNPYIFFKLCLHTSQIYCCRSIAINVISLS